MAFVVLLKLHYYLLLCVMVVVFLPVLCNAQSAFLTSRATYYGSPDCLGNPTGACGYGEYGRTVYDGKVAGVSRLYKNGSGCGACYQVKCKVPGLCIDDGVTVMATDYGESDRTDFILSASAFASLATPNLALELMAYGVVNIEYRRVPCQYPNSNLLFKIHEHSKYPHYLALVLLYQAGQYDVICVDVWLEDCQQWRSMRRAYGAVWDMENPPRGTIVTRVQLSGSAGVTWVQPQTGIPSNWKAGAVYDSYVQLT